MKTYTVYYGSDIRDLGEWECQAESENQAKSLFRKEFGFNFIKIQKVKEN